MAGNIMFEDDAMDDAMSVFVYMGEGGPGVPSDVVHVRIHPSVTVIPDRAFQDRKNWRWSSSVKAC